MQPLVLHTFVVAGSCRGYQARQLPAYVILEAAVTVFELLMMSGVSLETCWEIKKHWNNKFYYTVASCWLFLYDFFNKRYSVCVETAQCLPVIVQHKSQQDVHVTEFILSDNCSTCSGRCYHPSSGALNNSNNSIW